MIRVRRLEIPPDLCVRLWLRVGSDDEAAQCADEISEEIELMKPPEYTAEQIIAIAGSRIVRAEVLDRHGNGVLVDGYA